MIKSNFPNFSIVIPNYNGAKFIAPCLQALKKAIASCPKSKFEIILVDNGSSDNSVRIFKDIFPKDSPVILLPSNQGFATAVNTGIKASTYEHICVLNNDLNLAKNWFDLISQAIREFPQVATFCGTVLNHDGTKIESQGFRYYMSGRCENINNSKPFIASELAHQSASIPIWGSSAAVVVYQKTALIQVGLFDESFFAYIEDVDLGYRLHQHGYKTILVPLAISYHLGGSTSNNMGTLRQYYTLRNWIKLILKNYSTVEIIFNFPGIVIERLRNLSYYLKNLLK